MVVVVVKSKSAIVIRRGGGVPFIIIFRWCPGAAAATAATPPTSPKRRGLNKISGNYTEAERCRVGAAAVVVENSRKREMLGLYLHPVFHASNFHHSLPQCSKKLITFAGLIETHRMRKIMPFKLTVKIIGSTKTNRTLFQLYTPYTRLDILG